MKCKKYISLGGSCVAMPLLGNLRSKGPVDNMRAKFGLKSCLSLFDGFEKFKNSIINNKIIYKNINIENTKNIDKTLKFELENGLDKIYESKYYTIIHNEINEKFLVELEKRYNNLINNLYNKDFKLIYFCNYNDTLNAINDTLNILNKIGINPIIVSNNSKKFKSLLTQEDFQRINTSLKIDFDCPEIETEQENEKVANECHLKFIESLESLMLLH